ncbi:unnamed protein product, partial [Discosporangium mesarthrocarpum]
IPAPTPFPAHPIPPKSYTQYIPLSVYDLKGWAGTPSIFVLDCSAAGRLMTHLTAGDPL